MLEEGYSKKERLVNISGVGKGRVCFGNDNTFLVAGVQDRPGGG